MRLNNIVKQKKSIPFQPFIDAFREIAKGLLTGSVFKKYFSYLETQLRRADYYYLKPEGTGLSV